MYAEVNFDVIYLKKQPPNGDTYIGIYLDLIRIFVFCFFIKLRHHFLLSLRGSYQEWCLNLSQLLRDLDGLLIGNEIIYICRTFSISSTVFFLSRYELTIIVLKI